MGRGGGNKKRFQHCTDPSRQEILYLQVLQGHSGTISSSTFITSDVRSIYTPSRIQDWHQEDKIWLKIDGILHVCGSNEQGTQGSEDDRFGSTGSFMVPSEEVGETSKHGSIQQDQTWSNAIILNLRNHLRESMRHFDFFRRLSFKYNWMKELVSEVAGWNEDSQQTQPKKQKSNYIARWNWLRVSNHPLRLFRKSTKVSCLVAKAPM